METMSPQRDRGSGQYTPTYTDEEFVDTLAELGGEATSSEVANAIGCVRDSAYRRLNRLADEGTVVKRQAGRTLLWRLPEAEQ